MEQETHIHTILSSVTVTYYMCQCVCMTYGVLQMSNVTEVISPDKSRKVCAWPKNGWLHCVHAYTAHARYPCVSVGVGRLDLMRTVVWRWGLSYMYKVQGGDPGAASWAKLASAATALLRLQHTHTYTRIRTHWVGEMRSAWHSVKFLSPAPSCQALRRILYYTHRGSALLHHFWRLGAYSA